MRTHVATVTALALLTPITQLALPMAGAAEDLASRFTVQVMPDTQFYARYGTEAAGDIFSSRYGSNPFNSQTRFIADNQDKLGTQFVTHLGDLVDQPRDLASWDIASDAMKILEDAKVDYSVLPGNHDYAMVNDTSVFQRYFPQSRAEAVPTFQGRFSSTDIYNSGRNDYGFPGQTVDSEYHIFEAEGQRYLVLALGFRANDETLNWAQRVIDQHPELPVILTAHEIDAIDGQGNVFYSKEYGQHLWNKLIRKNDQIFLTIAAPAPSGSTIPDVAAGNDMTRARYRLGAKQEHVTFTTDKHPLSSDAGSLRFSEPTLKHGVSWFETADGAPVNSARFDKGYTLEAFLKLDEDWNGDDNGWSNALVRDIDGTGVNPDDPDGDPIQMLGVSNLRELRWYSLGENGRGFSNWTHEVPKGEWMHVAVVNDPTDQSVTMYVDGSPILRDGYGPVGMAGEGYKWILGTSEWETRKVDGWFGNIGEIRIVDHPIGKDEWLTARATTQEPEAPGTDTETPAPTPTPTPVPGAGGGSVASSSKSSFWAFVAGTVFGALGAAGAIAALLVSLGGEVTDQLRGMLGL